MRLVLSLINEINNTTIIKSYLDTLLLNNSTPLLGTSWGINRPTWSISAEFYAYILFSIGLLISIKILRKSFAWIVFFVSAVTLFKVSENGYYNNAEYGFLRCIFLFMMGVFIDNFKIRTTKIYPYFDFIFPAVAFTFLYLNQHYISSNFTHSIIELGLLPILFVFIIYRSIRVNGYLTKFFSTPVLQWLGKYSYSIYLNHALILLAVPKFIFQVVKLNNTPAAEYMVFGICIALTLVYSKLTYRFIEQNFYLTKNQ
jgi:hypothetical protein